MKLGIIVDSSAGISKVEAEKRGWGFLPLYITIDGKEYADGDQITPEEYYSKVNIDSDVRTSATPPGVAQELIEEFSKKFDYVLIYALSSKLSSQTNNLTMISQEYKNTYVVPSKGVGFAITRDCEDIFEFSKTTEDFEAVKEKANNFTDGLIGVAAPQGMKWLVKGGRVSAGAASMANLLRIVPLIAFKDGGLEKYGKGRVFKKAIVKFTKDLYEQYGDSREYIIYHGNNEDIDEIAESIREVVGKADITLFPNVIVNHTGPGVVAVITRKKL